MQNMETAQLKETTEKLENQINYFRELEYEKV